MGIYSTEFGDINATAKHFFENDGIRIYIHLVCENFKWEGKDLTFYWSIGDLNASFNEQENKAYMLIRGQKPPSTILNKFMRDFVDTVFLESEDYKEQIRAHIMEQANMMLEKQKEAENDVLYYKKKGEKYLNIMETYK
jgi:hypothetical protein